MGERIEEGEVARPDRFAQIGGVRDHGVSQPIDPGDFGDRRDGPPLSLDEKGHDARCRRQDEEGDFFDEQANEGRSRGPEDAPEGPVIQQQENEGERDQHRFGHEPQQKQRERQPVPAAPGALGVAGIGPERQQPEQGAQHVLALRDPGDRLDVQRMKREKRGRERARPARPGHPLQDPEEQDAVCGVQEQARQMMEARVQAEELAIEHVREPGQRVPVGRVAGREGPPHPLETEPRSDVEIFDDVLRIVVEDELVAANPSEGSEHADADEAGDPEIRRRAARPNGWGLDRHGRG